MVNRTSYAGLGKPGVRDAGLQMVLGSDGGEQAILAQKALERDVKKAWAAENREALEKYQRGVSRLKKLKDGINEWIALKEAPNMTGVGNEAEFQAHMAKYTVEFQRAANLANDLFKGLVESYRDRMIKAGVSTATGYNFYDLRGPAYLIYPVNTPLRNELPRWGKVNAGYGTMVNWKYTYLTPGTSYAGAKEGERVATATPGENNAVASYAELGVERAVTFTAQFAGEGYTDNVADEHIRGAHELWLQEEGLILGGNAGNGANMNGFQLGTANTPSVTLETSIPSGAPTDGGTGFSNGTHVSVRVVELTMLGNPNNAQYGYQAAPTVAAGLVPSYTRNNADNTSNTITGGMGAVSASSGIVSTTTSSKYVLCEVAPKKGAVAWAWFVDDTDTSTPAAANALLVAITTVPYVYLAGATPGSQAANATGLSTDNSAQSLDFTGILGWTVVNGTWINMSDLTSNSPVTGAQNNGLLNPGMAQGQNAVPAVAEIEYDLEAQWNALQAVADEIYCSADVKRNIQAALFTNTSGVPAYRFEVQRDAQGNILGGFVVSGYKNLYSMKTTGSEEIPIKIHPMMPPGSMLYRKTSNPYPHSRIPGVAGMFVQRDYYGIEWPITTRQWTFGTYVHEVYGDYIPAFLTFRTGITGVNT